MNRHSVYICLFVCLSNILTSSCQFHQRLRPPSHRSLDMFQPNFHQIERYRDTRSVHENPQIEVFMHVPSEFEDAQQFQRFLGIKPQKLREKRGDKKAFDEKSLVEVRKYQIAQLSHRNKREAENLVPDSENVESVPLTVIGRPMGESNGKYIQDGEHGQLVAEKLNSDNYPETIIQLPEPIRGPVYTAYPENLSEDPDDPRKRRNTSANDHDETMQRDKRTYMDASSDNREGTTPPPYWKRKKEGPTFVTGREARVQKGNTYTPAQHRSEGGRESHSMKDLDKAVQSNEISRNNQDSYYASSSNRRAYNSRQAENMNTPTPRSVYDIYDYTSPRRNHEGRSSYARNTDSTLKDNRQVYNDYYVNGQPRTYHSYGQPRVYYDRNYPYYYPYPGEVVGRGVEYYHRNIDPTSGRIIYYANMPDSVRSYDAYSGRTYYNNGRTYVYDAYGRVIPLPTPAMDLYGRPVDYRYGRSLGGGGGEYYPYGSEKYPRGVRYDSKSDRYKDENKNKTYVIFETEEKRANTNRGPFSPYDYNRYLYPGADQIFSPQNIPPTGPYPQTPYPQTSYPQPQLPPNNGYNRNYYYQPVPSAWQGNQRPFSDPTYSPRPHTPSYTSLTRTPSTSNYDKIKKI